VIFRNNKQLFDVVCQKLTETCHNSYVVSVFLKQPASRRHYSTSHFEKQNDKKILVIPKRDYRSKAHYLPYTCQSFEDTEYNNTITNYMDSLAANSNRYYNDHGKIVTTLYKEHIQKETKFIPLDINQEHKELLEDWNEVLAIITDMKVVPEEADQLSGNIYGIYITEDYCSKSLRLSESWNSLSIRDITRIISNVQLWLNECDYEKLLSIWKSDATQAILFSLDDTCLKRISELDDSVKWNWAINFCRLQNLFRCIKSREHKSQYLVKFFQEQITSIDENSPGCVSEMNKEQFVIFMCIVSVIDCAPFIHGDFEQLKDIFNTKISMLFDKLTPEELVICYTALKRLNSTSATKLGDKISAKYGYRF